MLRSSGRRHGFTVSRSLGALKGTSAPLRGGLPPPASGGDAQPGEELGDEPLDLFARVGAAIGIGDVQARLAERTEEDEAEGPQRTAVHDARRHRPAQRARRPTAPKRVSSSRTTSQPSTARASRSTIRRTAGSW